MPRPILPGGRAAASPKPMILRHAGCGGGLHRLRPGVYQCLDCEEIIEVGTPRHCGDQRDPGTRHRTLDELDGRG